MKRILTGAAALRREDRLQQREDRLTDKTSALRAQIANLTAENERLRALVIRAYAEGFGDGWGEYDEQLSEGVERDWCWERSDTRAALQPKEGEG